MVKVAEKLSADQIEHFYVPSLKRLAVGDWFTSRASACSLFAPIYGKTDVKLKAELCKCVLGGLERDSDNVGSFCNCVKTKRPWFVVPPPTTWPYVLSILTFNFD
jgi:serine/threonine-protein phosphatase 2A regulatory subunit A